MDNTGGASARPVAWLSALALLLCACPERATTPFLHSVSPSQVNTRSGALLTLRGGGLYDRADVQLSSTRAAAVKRAWRVQVGAELEIDEVTRDDASTLHFTLPARAVADGEYELRVITPSGLTLRVDEKLTVGAAPYGGQLELDTAAGDALSERTLYVGERLEVHAVFRDPDSGEVIDDQFPVSWSIDDPLLELSAPEGASVQLLALSQGDTRLVALSSTGARAEVVLHVRLPDATRMHLQLENAAAGSGEPLAGELRVSSDDPLDSYAVLRDNDGTFLADVAADYRIQPSAAAELAQDGSHAHLSFGMSGALELFAHYEALPDVAVKIVVVPGRARSLSIEPSTAQLKVGDLPLQFVARGRDAHDEATDDLGELSWSVEADAFGDLDSGLGLLTPLRAGESQVHVVSSYGASASSGVVQVLSGRAQSLTIANVPIRPLHAGDPPVALQARGLDENGAPSDDLGTLTWSLVRGSFSELDPSSGVVSPHSAGSAVVHVHSSYGLDADSQIITILPSVLASLHIVPDTLTISADDPATQFTVTGSDAYGNATAAVGSIAWSIGTGSFGALDAAGQLTPGLAGSGTVHALSSLGPSADSGEVRVTPGRATQLKIAPSTWTGTVGDDPQTFVASGLDADANVTTDIGQITFAIAMGPITQIDASTGVFTALTAGDGNISATSDRGLLAQTTSVHVEPFNVQTSVSAVRAPSALFLGQRAARIEVDVRNLGTRDVVTTGAAFSISGYTNAAGDYTLTPDWNNDDRVPALSTRTLVFWMDVSSSVNFPLLMNTASVNIAATVDIYHPLSGFVSSNKTASSTVYNQTAATVALTAPTATGNRVCTGAALMFGASSSLSSPSYAWLLLGGAPLATLVAAPTVSYLNPGAFAYSVTVSNSSGNLTSTALASQPIFASVAHTDAGTPTGTVVFSKPTVGQAINLNSLPRSDVFALDHGSPLRGCEGSALAPGQNHLTLFVDRGALDPALDDDPSTPGIQVALTQGDLDLPAITWSAAPTPLEGPTLVYAEYFDPSVNAVTAAGSVAFSASKDTQAPSITGTYPRADCTADCLNTGDPLVFRFSEPIKSTSLSQLQVKRVLGSSCSDSSDISLLATSTYSYDNASRTLLVYPSSIFTDTYPVRVTLPAGITDTGTPANALTQLVRCAYMAPLSAVPKPAAPQLMAAPAALSPDGDGVSETTSWQVAVDAETRVLHLRILRGTTDVWGYTEISDGAGSFTLSWDGRDAGGRVVPPGFYRFELSARNRAHTSSALTTGVVEVQSAVHWIAVPRRY